MILKWSPLFLPHLSRAYKSYQEGIINPAINNIPRIIKTIFIIGFVIFIEKKSIKREIKNRRILDHLVVTVIPYFNNILVISSVSDLAKTVI